MAKRHMKKWSTLRIIREMQVKTASLIAQLIKNPPAIQETPCLIPGLGRSTGEGIGYPLQCSWASLVAQLVKNLPAMKETWVWSLGWENPLEKGKVTHSGILAWRIPWTVQSWGHKESDTTQQLSLHFRKEESVWSLLPMGVDMETLQSQWFSSP